MGARDGVHAACCARLLLPLHQPLPMLPRKRQTSRARTSQRFTLQKPLHSRFRERQAKHRLVIIQGCDHLTLGSHGYPVTEEIIKYHIIDDYGRPDGRVQTERMEHDTQHIGTELPGLAGSLHGPVKRPALIIQWLSTAPAMFGLAA